MGRFDLKVFVNCLQDYAISIDTTVILYCNGICSKRTVCICIYGNSPSCFILVQCHLLLLQYNYIALLVVLDSKAELINEWG